MRAVDIVFRDAELPRDTGKMPLNLAVLAQMLQFSVRFRYQVLQSYAGRKLEGRDVLAFNRALIDLQREAMGDPRLAKDRSLLRKQTMESFTGEDKVMVEKMYKRWDELYRSDGTGEMDQAIVNMDSEALANIVEDLMEINRQFLMITSRRFAELIATAHGGSG